MNHLLSIALGLLAWTLPLVYLFAGKHRGLLAGGSFGLCALSVYLQLREVLRLVEKGDFSAIADTIGAVVFAATVLLTVTLVLNTLTLARKERRSPAP